MTYYKVLDEKRRSMHGGTATWVPGQWMPRLENPVLCQRGYHACRPQDLIFWLGPEIWEVECEGVIEGDNKIVCERARIVRRVDTWNGRTARLFAADCAESVLHLYEARYPGDDRPRKAIQAARNYAEGRIDSAARSAAYWAARSAARSAADSAAYWAARSAAHSAARSAADSAAHSAARSAADSAAYSAQTARLFDYLEGRAG